VLAHRGHPAEAGRAAQTGIVGFDDDALANPGGVNAVAGRDDLADGLVAGNPWVGRRPPGARDQRQVRTADADAEHAHDDLPGTRDGLRQAVRDAQ
jgi:hypothetical protein